MSGFAQTFILTADGFRNKTDISKDYEEICIPRSDQQTVSRKVKNYLAETYNSPWDVITEPTADVVSVLGMETVGKSAQGGKFYYKLDFEFHDNCVKVTPTWIDLAVKGRAIPLCGDGGIYNADGELQNADTKLKIEVIIFSIVLDVHIALYTLDKPNTKK